MRSSAIQNQLEAVGENSKLTFKLIKYCYTLILQKLGINRTEKCIWKLKFVQIFPFFPIQGNCYLPDTLWS